MKILGQTILLTGASQSAVQVIARYFLESGAKLALLVQDDEGNYELQKQFYPSHFLMLEVNFHDETSIKEAYDRAISNFGQIRIFIHLYMAMHMQTLINEESHSLHKTDTFTAMVASNIYSKFMCCKYAAAHLRDLPKREKEHGVIVNVSSIVATDGPRGAVAYSTTQAAVYGMTLPLARDLGKYGIRVVCVSGGGFKEPMKKLLSPEALQFIKTQIPLGEFPEFHDFAQMLEMVVRTPSLNGEIIRFDGGLRLPHL